MASVPEMALHPWEVLLDRAGSDRVGEEACDRNKGQAQTNTVRRSEETETVYTEKKSIGSAEVKKRGREVSRRAKHQQSYTSRGDAELAEGRSGNSRRSPEELGIVFPAEHCTANPNNAHYYVEVFNEIFRCKYCQEVVWQPSWYATAVAFTEEIRKVGLQKAYQMRISRMPGVLDKLLSLRQDQATSHD